MSLAYTRPFRPLDFTSRAAALFSLGDMINQLRHEPVYQSANRNALTLVHDAGLTAVLTVVKEGAQCEEHFSQEPTIFLTLEGELAIESFSDGGILYLSHNSAGALAPDVRHKVTASTDCAYLIVMGHLPKTATSAGRRPTISGKRSIQRDRLAVSSKAEPDAIEDLVYELRQCIDAAPATRRDELRTYATDLLAANMSSARAQAEEVRRSGQHAPLNSFAEAFLLGLIGLPFLFFLPPIAVMFMILAVLFAAAGMLRVLASRGVKYGGHLLRLTVPLRGERAGRLRA